jgi:hypothetical protein
VGERKKKEWNNHIERMIDNRVVKIAVAIDKLSQVVAVIWDFQKVSDQVVAKTPFAWFFKAGA